MALSVIFESGRQNIPDTPGSNKMNPGIEFLKKAHSVWDDIHFMDGYAGKFVILARRKGNDWFISGINSDTSREVTINTDFIKPGQYRIKLYSDGPDKNILANKDFLLDTFNPFKITMAVNGGFCAKIADSAK